MLEAATKVGVGVFERVDHGSWSHDVTVASGWNDAPDEHAYFIVLLISVGLQAFAPAHVVLSAACNKRVQYFLYTL